MHVNFFVIEDYKKMPALGVTKNKANSKPITPTLKLPPQRTGTTNWTTMETPFFLKKGENPDNIKLNLVIKGKGTVWIDDIRLLKAPLSFEDLMSNSSFVIPEDNLQTLRKCLVQRLIRHSNCIRLSS